MLVGGVELVALLDILKSRQELGECVLRDSSLKRVPVLCTGRGGLVLLAQLLCEFPVFVIKKIALAAVEDDWGHSFHQVDPGGAPLGQSGDEFF